MTILSSQERRESSPVGSCKVESSTTALWKIAGVLGCLVLGAGPGLCACFWEGGLEVSLVVGACASAGAVGALVNRYFYYRSQQASKNSPSLEQTGEGLPVSLEPASPPTGEGCLVSSEPASPPTGEGRLVSSEPASPPTGEGRLVSSEPASPPTEEDRAVSFECSSPPMVVGESTYSRNRTNCEEAILELAKQFGVPLFSNEIRKFFEEENSKQTLASDVSNSSWRKNQFLMETPEAKLAQRYWKQSSDLILKVIKLAVEADSFQELLFPIGEKGQSMKSYPALFVYLGLSRYLLHRSLLALRKKDSAVPDTRTLIDEYFKERNYLARCSSLWHGVFHLETEKEQTTCFLQEIVQSTGFGESIYSKLQDALKDLVTQCTVGEPQEVVHFTLLGGSAKQVRVYCDSKCTLKEKEWIQTVLETWNFYSWTSVFIFKEKSGEKYIIFTDEKNRYDKYFISALDDNFVVHLGTIKHEIYDSSQNIRCEHKAEFFDMWDFLTPKLNVVLQAIRDENTTKDEYLQKIGEFVFLFINMMPYKGGSAAIAEWLMRGLASVRGIDLGPFNQDKLSWDFSAFVALSPEQYGQQFKQFFSSVR